jgi:hypothetical protein
MLVNPATPDQIAQFGHISIAIRKLLKDMNWSMGDLNDALGISRLNTGTYQWANAKGAPGPKTQAKLAKMSGLKASDFARRIVKTSKSQEVVKYRPQPQLQPPAAALTHPKASEVLTFTVLDNGRARIKLDVTLATEDAMPLMRLLMDAEAVRTQSNSITGNPQSGMTSLPRED